MVETLPKWAKAVLAVFGLALVGWGVSTLLRPDSPWCVDEGGPGSDFACPVEVRFDDEMYAVECVDASVPIAADGRTVEVQQNDGEVVTTRRAHEIQSVSPEDVILLERTGESSCTGTEIAYSQDVSGREAVELVGADAASIR